LIAHRVQIVSSCFNSHVENTCVTALFHTKMRFYDLKLTLTPSLCIEMLVPSQENERSCIRVRGIDFASFYDF